MRQQAVNSTHTAIIEAGNTLFQQHGIRRVSVTEICATAKTSKVTFYKYFKNKQGLAKDILNDMYSKSVADFQKITEMDTSFYQKVHELMLLKLAALKTFSPVFLQDLLTGDFPEIQEFMELERMNQQQRLHDFFESGIESNEIRQDLSVETLQFFMDQMQTMIFSEQFCKIEPSLNNRVMRAMEYFFYGIKNHD